MAEDRIGKDRMLELYTRLAEGKLIYKAEEAEHYKCSLRSIQRDIEDLRTFFHNQSDASGVVQDIIYDKKLKGYKLVPPLRNVISSGSAPSTAAIRRRDSISSRAAAEPFACSEEGLPQHCVIIYRAFSTAWGHTRVVALLSR